MAVAHASNGSSTSQRRQPDRNPLFLTHQFRPYYAPAEVLQLVQLQAQGKGDGAQPYSEHRVEGWRQLACGFIERVGARLGFPRRTIATAQSLYHRFHLHFPLRDFAYPDVSIAALLVASKLEDTLKKLRDIQIAAWQIQNLLEGGTGVGDGDLAVRSVSPNPPKLTHPDQHRQKTQEHHRPRLISIERLLLQTICFNFNLHRAAPEDAVAELGRHGVADSRDIFAWVVRLAASLNATKSFTLFAHLLAIDVHRTRAPLSYPPHTLAASCLWLASFLSPSHPHSLTWRGEDTAELRATLVAQGAVTFDEDWCRRFESAEEDVEEIAHTILNLLIQLCPPLTSTATSSQGGITASPFSTAPSPTFSPFSPAQPHAAGPQHHHPTQPRTAQQLEREKQLLQTGVPHVLSGVIVPVAVRTVDDLMNVKIRLREVGAAGRGPAARPKRLSSSHEIAGGEDDSNGDVRIAKRWRGEAGDDEDVLKAALALGAKERDRERRPISVQYMF